MLEDIAEDREEWLASLDYIYAQYGRDGVKTIIGALHERLPDYHISLAGSGLNTPYINSIAPAEQPPYPGDLGLEKRIENIVRWNAMAMVLQAQDAGAGVGGHIATYASAATILEVGFNHFFRAAGDDYPGDIVIPQAHAAPGVYARAYLEGRLGRQQLHNFRRELGRGGGLCSYPHPRSMPDFWQMPCASMGLSTPAAIYQARMARYLEHRRLKASAEGKVWCFIGDGEADEPEVLGTINIAARERLDNLILVVNCNLQRLDGPVRGNGKIIQELERGFRGADWRVIKVIWGSGWDSLLANDVNHVLRKRMDECLDGDYQRYSVLPGGRQREHWVEGNPELERMMSALTDDEVKNIKRGGQDPKKIYAAFKRASETRGKPVVILIKTVKGDAMGEAAQGLNTAHQKKNIKPEQRIKLAREYGIPISDKAAAKAAFYKPGPNSEELDYLLERRRQLGGFVPARTARCAAIEAPEPALFADILAGSGSRAISTTMVMVRLLGKLLKHEALGPYIVPIVPDEARTFGMEGLFKQAGIYSPDGQKYTPVDADSLLPYYEARDGQILQEGICETGALASFMAAGSAYAIHGLPMIPFYIFYSIFGFQRVGDMIWSCGDMMCRGFLLGATAGRTTLNGEGLQHQDGHSHISAATVPNLLAYDPAFGYEFGVIIREGIRRMYTEQEDIFYYITVYNENYRMPPIPEDPAVSRGILRGGYCLQRSQRTAGEIINLLAGGAIMQQAIKAAAELEALGYRVNLWSITSFTELEREAERCRRWNRLHPRAAQRRSHVEQLFADQPGIFIAVSDYAKGLANGIGNWIPGAYEVLGTDGYGLSESRADLRDFFEISADYIAQAAVSLLYREGRVGGEALQHLELSGPATDKIDPMTRQ